MLAHFNALVILYMAQDHHVFIRRLVKELGGDGHERIEPAAGLINSLADEVGGEVIFKHLLVFEGIVPLRKGHRTGVKPAVNHL